MAECSPWCCQMPWGKAASTLVSLILGTVMGKEQFLQPGMISPGKGGCKRDETPCHQPAGTLWAASHCHLTLGMPPQTHTKKEQPASSPPLKSRRLLAKSTSLHEKVPTCPIRHLDS